MTLGVAAASMFRGRWRIYAPKVNWDEEFWLVATTAQTAVKALAEGAWWRAAWFAGDVYIGNGSVSNPGKPRDRWPFTKAQQSAYAPPSGYPWAIRPLYNPFADAATVEGCNDPFTGPFYEMGTVGGKWAERIFGGVPDGDITALQWIGAGTITVPESPPEVATVVTAPGNPATSTPVARSMYLYWLKNSTQWAQRVDGPGPVIIGTSTYNTDAWDACTFSRCGKHDRGGIREFQGRRPSGS